MTQKQYDDMATIMLFGRIFADQMQKCLKRTGLSNLGFNLNVNVHDVACDEGITLASSVYLQRDYLNDENDHSDDMTQLKFVGKGWSVAHDPYAKAGSVPPEVHFDKRTGNDSKRVAETSNKPYPPDGLWIGADYNHPYVGGGQ